MNPAVFDAVFTAIASHPRPLPADFKDRFGRLVKSNEFKSSASYRTTDADAVGSRLKLARTDLFDEP